MFRTLAIAILALSAILLSSQGEARKPKAYSCMAASQYGSQSITVSQRYTAAGMRTGNPNVATGNRIPADAASAIVAQLTQRIESLSSDLEQNCTPDTWKEELRYDRFVCEESWTEGLDRFDITQNGDQISVYRTYPSGMVVYTNQQSIYIHHSPFDGRYADEDFLRDGLMYAKAIGRPFVTVTMPEPWGSDRTLQFDAAGKLISDSDNWGEVRVGEKHERRWSSSNTLLFLPADVLDPLLSEPGDIVLSANSVKRGLVAREVLPRDFREQWEDKLKQGYRRLLAKQADPINQCQHTLTWQGPPIILVH